MKKKNKKEQDEAWLADIIKFAKKIHETEDSRALCCIYTFTKGYAERRGLI